MKPKSQRTTSQDKPDDTRLSRGRTRPEAIFPVAPLAASLPESYAATLQEIKSHLRSARIRAVLAANPIVIEAYWQTGKIILARQQEAGWGAKIIDRLAADLQAEFADMSGLTRRNLFSMRAFAEAFPDGSIVKRLVSQLPWGQIIRLIQMVKDPYLFDFLGTADPRREVEVEQALVDHIQKFLLELGTGFAFVGRQVPLEVGGEDYPLDLLFYHLKLRRYVVIELKARAFTPGDVGQLNLYLSAVDDLLRHPDDQPTIGLLLCRKKNRLVAEYALRGLDQPIAVAAWQTQLTESLPAEFRGSLPTIEEIEAELANDLPNDPEVKP